MCFNKMRNYTIRPGNLSRSVSSVVYHNNDLKLPGPATSLVLGSKQEIVVRKSSQNLEGNRKVVQDQPLFVEYIQNNYPELMGGSSRGGSSSGGGSSGVGSSGGASSGGASSGGGSGGRGYNDSVYGSNGSSVYGSNNVENIGIQTDRGVNVGTETDNNYLASHYAMQQALGQEIAQLQHLRTTDAAAYQDAFLRLTEWLGVSTLAVRGQMEQLARGQIGTEEFHDGIHEIYNEGILGAIDDRAAMRRTFLENLPSIPDTNSVIDGLLSAVASSVYSAIDSDVLSNLNRQLQGILIDNGVPIQSDMSLGSGNSYMSREAVALLENERQRNAGGGGEFVPFVGPSGFVANGLLDSSSSSENNNSGSSYVPSSSANDSDQLGLGHLRDNERQHIEHQRGLRSNSPSVYEDDVWFVNRNRQMYPSLPSYTNTPSYSSRSVYPSVPSSFNTAPPYASESNSVRSSIQSSIASRAGQAAGDVGASVGAPIGVALGTGLGGAIGTAVGGPAGAAIGAGVGSSVGSSLGNSLGRSIGSSVGRGAVNTVGDRIFGNSQTGLTPQAEAAIRRSTRVSRPVVRPNYVSNYRGSQSGASTSSGSALSSGNSSYRP